VCFLRRFFCVAMKVQLFSPCVPSSGGKQFLLANAMRLPFAPVIALWLILTATGMAVPVQDPASPASASEGGQAPRPAENAQAAPANPQAADAGKSAQENASEQKPDAAPVNAPKKRHRRPTPVPGGPRKVVVREGGASEPPAQIAPGMTHEEASRERQQAQRLLSSADERLKQLTARALDARQQETAAQIHNYLEGARSALKEGDVGRANTLAEKAHLLAEDLMKQ
jgi:hypothetical protein